jgi:2-polyprenyl-6-methoxyphenol hydroxylase-like FAD-dependent oxidoreductase
MKKPTATNNSHLGTRAIIIGAGIGGLAAARALSDRFTEVIVFERDELSTQPAPRPGIPQGRHPHGLLAGAMVALEDLFPGFTQDLARAGAVPVDAGADVLYEVPGVEQLPRRYLGCQTYALSRPLLEFTLLQRIRQYANIRVHGQCSVSGIIGAPDGSVVTGIQYESNGVSATLSADLVVDASGHGAPTMDFLRFTGRPLPQETTIGVDIRYSSALFAPPRATRDFKVIVTFPKAPQHVRYGYILPAENDLWQVLLVGRGNDTPPVHGDAYLDYAQHLETPTIYNAIRDAELVGKIHRFGFAESSWRHFGKLEDFPHRLLPLGDTICRFNPVWGQGMTVALQEANMLFHLLQTESLAQNPIAILGQAFLAETETLIADPWAMSVTPDFVYPETRGERPPDLLDKLRFQGALQRVAISDPAIYRLYVEVRHLLKPLSALETPEILRRVEEEMTVAV